MYSLLQYNYDKTIVDSGTTNLRVSEEIFNSILDRLRKFDRVCTIEYSFEVLTILYNYKLQYFFNDL